MEQSLPRTTKSCSHLAEAIRLDKAQPVSLASETVAKIETARVSNCLIRMAASTRAQAQATLRVTKTSTMAEDKAREEDHYDS